jgi:hypothetical protein
MMWLLCREKGRRFGEKMTALKTYHTCRHCMSTPFKLAL